MLTQGCGAQPILELETYSASEEFFFLTTFQLNHNYQSYLQDVYRL